MGGELGKESWALAKQIWQHLRPKVEASAAASEAVADVAAKPEDADAQEALRLQIKKILSNDNTLLEALAGLLKEVAPGQHYAASVTGSGAAAVGPNATAVGAGGVAIGGNVQGGVRIVNRSDAKD